MIPFDSALTVNSSDLITVPKYPNKIKLLCVEFTIGQMIFGQFLSADFVLVCDSCCVGELWKRQIDRQDLVFSYKANCNIC